MHTGQSLNTLSPADRRGIRNMDTTLVVPVAVLVGAVALAFYMDWLGLWVSKEEMREEIARARERLRGSGTPTRNTAPGPGDKAREGAATVASGRAVAFDLDPASLISLGEAVPGWEIEVVSGATAASLSGAWDPGPVDLLVVGARANVRETLGPVPVPDFLHFLLGRLPEGGGRSRGAARERTGRGAACGRPTARSGAARTGGPGGARAGGGRPQLSDAAHLRQGGSQHAGSRTRGQSAGPAHAQPRSGPERESLA